MNSLSEKCAEGFLARDMGSTDILQANYVMCLTAEDTKVSKTHKIRAMVMKQETMEYLAQADLKEPVLENPVNIIRYDLMVALSKNFMELEKANENESPTPNVPIVNQLAWQHQNINPFFKFELVTRK